jgi:hypothetical protein
MISFVKLKKILTAKKARDMKFNYLNLPWKSDISYILLGKKYNVSVFFKIKKKARYYFEDENTLTLFVSRRSAFKTRINTANVSKQILWSAVKCVRLPWKKDISESPEEYITVFNQFPTELADNSSREATLGNNDLALGKIHVFNLEGYIDFLNNQK